MDKKKPITKKSVRSELVDQIKSESKEPSDSITPRVEFISTGSTVLNLAASQKGRDGGWARGRIINIVGDGSSGKCVKNGTVLSSRGFQILDDIGKDIEEGAHIWSESLSVNKNIIEETDGFWKEAVNKTIYIKTRHGYEIEGTGKHKVAVWNKQCCVEMKGLCDIKEGDFAIIARGTNRYPKEYYSIENLDSYYLVPPPMSTNHKKIKLPKYVTPNIGSLLGLLVGDGGFLDNSLGFSNSKTWFKKELDNSLLDFGMDSSNQSVSGTVYACSYKMTAIIHELCGNPKKFTARYKYVPECIMESPKDVQIAFIKSLLDCDSYSDTNTIQWSSASEKLAKQIHLMLLNLGVVSTLSSKHGVFDGNKYQDHTYYGITVYGPDFIRYAAIVGSNRWDFSKTLIKKSTRKSSYDSIPFLQDFAIKDRDAVRKGLGWCKNGKMKNKEGRFPRFLFAGTANFTYERLLEFINIYSSLGDVWDLSFYKEILSNEYHFDPIVMKEQRTESTDVFDVHVPNGHLFWCNGFINHNSLLSIEACANAFYKIKDIKSELYPPVKNVQIVYNNVEGVMDFPLEEMYGTAFVEGVEWIQTDTCQAFGKDYQKRLRALKPGDFLLYVVDSLDATISEEAKARMAQTLDDKKPDASYGMEKAKFFSQEFFSHLCGAMEGKDATLICISQVRENIGVSFGEKYRRVGGKALDFFTHQVAWIATIEKLKKTFRGHERVFGVRGKATFKRNKVAKPFRIADFTVLFDYGVDDVGSMVDYLYGPKVKNIDWNGAEFKRQEFIEMIESDPVNEDKLRELVEKDWHEIEAAVVPDRKKRW